jgi:type IV secretory pathway TraG/TraD family ATPase VirD4
MPSDVCARVPPRRHGPTTSRRSQACTTRRSPTCSVVRGVPTTASRILASCAAKQMAARSATRRLTPPLGLFLDECANIAPLPSLPQLVTDGAGQGITTMIVLQSLGQARARWGVDGTAALWDGCTVKIVLGGLADTRDLETVSRMCGDVDIEVPGRSYTAAGEQTRSYSHRRVPAFAPEHVRTLRQRRGLLFYEELRPIETVLPGWWDLARYHPRVERALTSFAMSRVSGT